MTCIQTGLILSDTDFRQFEQYGGLTGLDIALVKDSYKYHTRLDLVEYIERGALQHWGDNLITMLKVIGSSDPSKFQGLKRTRDTLYFTALGGKVLIMVKAHTTTVAYIGLFLISLFLSAARADRTYLAGYITCFISAPLTHLSGIVSANVVALVMTKILVKPLSYFRKEWWCVPLYGAPAILGMFLLYKHSFCEASDPDYRFVEIRHAWCAIASGWSCQQKRLIRWAERST